MRVVYRGNHRYPMTVELVGGRLIYRREGAGEVFWSLAPSDPEVGLLALADATLAERLALHYAGFEAIRGLNVTESPPDPDGPGAGARDLGA